MEYTEDEARTKQCPKNLGMKCVASECLAWQQYHDQHHFDDAGKKHTVGYCSAIYPVDLINTIEAFNQAHELRHFPELKG